MKTVEDRLAIKVAQAIAAYQGLYYSDVSLEQRDRLFATGKFIIKTIFKDENINDIAEMMGQLAIALQEKRSKESTT